MPVKFKDALELTYKLFPLLIIFFLLQDISLFIYIYKFDIGYLKTIFSHIDFLDSSIIFLLLLIPITLILMISLCFALLFYFSDKLSKYEKFKELIVCNCSRMIAFNISTILSYIFIFYFGMELIDKVWDNMFIFYLFLLFMMLVYISFLRATYLVYYSNCKKTFIPLSLIQLIIIAIFTVITIFFDELKNFQIPTFIMLIFTIFTYLFDETEKREKKQEKEKTTQTNNESHEHNVLYKLLFLPVVIIIIFAFILDSNQKVWTEEITEDSARLENMSINFLLNKGLLLQNSVDVEIEIQPKYYKEQLKEYCAYKPTKDNKIINENACKNLNAEKIKVVLENSYWYLELSSNIKLYFANLYNTKKEFKGFATFLIEEKPFANRIGREHILINTQSINFKE